MAVLSSKPGRFVRSPEFVQAWQAVDERGLCRGRAPLWDAFSGDSVPYALAHCALCPVREECLFVVKPQESFFDGVCAGVVWREGRVHA